MRKMWYVLGPVILAATTFMSCDKKPDTSGSVMGIRLDQDPHGDSSEKNGDPDTTPTLEEWNEVFRLLEYTSIIFLDTDGELPALKLDIMAGSDTIYICPPNDGYTEFTFTGPNFGANEQFAVIEPERDIRFPWPEPDDPWVWDWACDRPANPCGW